MFKRLSTLFIIASIAALAIACSATPHLRGHWGKSIETAKEAQIVNPQAGRVSMPAPEMDGNATGHAVDSYHESFRDVKTQN
jgi:hypothetical protein